MHIILYQPNTDKYTYSLIHKSQGSFEEKFSPTKNGPLSAPAAITR